MEIQPSSWKHSSPQQHWPKIATLEHCVDCQLSEVAIGRSLDDPLRYLLRVVSHSSFPLECLRMYPAQYADNLSVAHLAHWLLSSRSCHRQMILLVKQMLHHAGEQQQLPIELMRLLPNSCVAWPKWKMYLAYRS